MPKKPAYPNEYPWNLLLAIKGRTGLSLPVPSANYRPDGLDYVLSLLNETDRELLRLRYREGRSTSETASLLGLPPEEFHAIEKNALEKLRSDTRWGYIRWGISGYLRRRIAEEYQKGYHAGYCAGYQQGMAAPPSSVSDDVLDLPLEMLGLTRRTFHCLDRYGYQHIRDIVALKESKIRVIRNLGTVAAREIVDKLHEYGIFYTDWDIFLQKK